jgi:hypothetical protein
MAIRATTIADPWPTDGLPTRAWIETLEWIQARSDAELAELLFDYVLVPLTTRTPPYDLVLEAIGRLKGDA